jgi:hypothetical protein
MDLATFTNKVASLIESMPSVDTVTTPESSLRDSRFIGITLQDGQQFSIHVQETQ